MYKKKFKIEGDREYDVYAENYSSANEVMAVARTRPRNDHISSRYDCLVGSGGWFDRDWDGFETKEELENLIKYGIRDAKLTSEVQRYAYKAYVQEKDKFSRRVLSVAGGGVNVPLMLSGSPEVMYSRAKAPVHTKIINMGIGVEIVAGVDSEDYAHAGMLIAELICKLEKAGYRVRLQTLDAYYAETKRINVLSTVLKKENEPMNYARMFFPLTSVASSRGLGFGWAARNQDFNHDLGTYTEFAFSSEDRNVKMAELYENSTGLKGFTMFGVKDVINMIRRKGDEATMKYIESRLISSLR